MGTNRYNAESIGRALVHHELRGTVRSWSPPERNGRRTWIVNARGGDTYEFTTPQAYAFVVALAVAERAAEQ